jgi:hypothetical protein
MGQLPESTVNEVAADGQTYSLAAVSATIQYRWRPGPGRDLRWFAWRSAVAVWPVRAAEGRNR